jgi:hypothetical protein
MAMHVHTPTQGLVRPEPRARELSEHPKQENSERMRKKVARPRTTRDAADGLSGPLFAFRLSVQRARSARTVSLSDFGLSFTIYAGFQQSDPGGCPVALAP